MNGSRDAGRGQGADTSASSRLCAEAAAVVGSWRPARPDEERCAELAAVLPLVREWVAAAEPAGAKAARRLMWAAAPMAVWLRGVSGSLDAAMLTGRNVEVWVNTVNGHRPASWRNAARSSLRRLGRAVNPGGWPQTETIGRRPVAEPYDSETEAVLLLAAGLPGRGGEAARLWVAAAGCGAGLTGVEMLAARTGDLIELGDGRLGVAVRGRRPRTVPVRSRWTGAVRDAARLALLRESETSCSGVRFVLGCKNAVSQVAAGLDFGEGGFSLRRARSTWIAAHLAAGTPYLALRAIAGGLSADTLAKLAEATDKQTGAEQAVIEGLRA